METKLYILTTHNAESKGCAPELTLEEWQKCPEFIQKFYSHRELLK